MSGIEVAGLILGALPLFISALEHWRETKEVVGNFWEYRSAHQKCLDDLLYSKYIFTSNLEELLLPLVCNEREANLLLGHPGGDMWREPALEERLKNRLGDGYDHYLRAIKAIKDVLHKLRNDLGMERLDLKWYLGQDVTDPVRILKYVNIQVLKVKFALGKPPRDDLFKSFEKYNDRLEKLLHKGDISQQIKRTLKSFPRSLTESINLNRRRVTTLHTLLAKAWTCGCKQSHRANLRLNDQINEETCFKFDILFTNDAATTEAGNWTYRDTSINVINQVQTQDVLAPASKPKPALTTEHTGSFLRRIFKKVTASKNRVSQSSNVESLLKTTQTHILPKSIPPEYHEIQDLCSTLASFTNMSSDACCGILRDHATNEHYKLFPKTVDLAPIPLRALLGGNSSAALSRRQRYDLAAILALSNLIHNATPWQTQGHVKDCVVFFTHADPARAITVNYPHLVHDFRPQQSVSANDNSRNPQVLVRLGILLLELCFGTTLEATAIRKRYPIVTDASVGQQLDYAAALEWSKQVLEEAGPLYATAVDFCLKLGASATSTNEDWQTKLLESVVGPLRECCDHLR